VFGGVPTYCIMVVIQNKDNAFSRTNMLFTKEHNNVVVMQGLSEFLTS
jgi:hypothetical protein